MKTSESIAQIAKALSVAQGKMRNPPCDKLVKVQHKNGGSHQYKYATLPSVFDVARSALSEVGISHTTSQFDDGKGITITTRLMHESGEWIESSMPLPYQNDPKLMAGSLTYYRRYLFNGLVGIAGDDDLDDDTNDRKELPENPGGHVMLTSKAFKGKRLSECDPNKLAEYEDWITHECSDPSPTLLEDRDAIVRFREAQKVKQ